MSIFGDALGAARDGVRDTYAVPMTITPVVASDYKGAHPDPNRPPLPCGSGILHEHVINRRGAGDREGGVIERTDGGRPGGRFGIDIASAPVRISFDVADLGGWLPPQGTWIDIDGTGRRFEVTHAGPISAGRVTLFVTEL